MGSSPRHSLSASHTLPFQIDDDGSDIESEKDLSEASHRALHSRRHSNQSGSMRFSNDNALENGAASPVLKDNLVLQQKGFFRSQCLNTMPAVSPLPEEHVHPLSIEAVDKEQQDKETSNSAMMLPLVLEYASCFIHLAVFGILGVLSRCIMNKVLRPRLACVTSARYPLYLDLPFNMVGPFLMGWWGVVFIREIESVSDHLAIGLTTGYIGSLSSFSGWNLKMLILIADGEWAFAVVEFLIGLFLSAYSIKFGIGTAMCFKSLLERLYKSTEIRTSSNRRIESCKPHLAVRVLLVLLLVLIMLLCLSAIMLKKEFSSGSDGAQLWLACLVGVPGVWVRWFLARFNGCGLGKTGHMKWVPFGTLIANVSSVCVAAALSTLKRKVRFKTCNIIATGMQLGFCACLSSVSAFSAEYNAMEESNANWRAYAYALATILISFGLGFLIFCVPVYLE